MHQKETIATDWQIIQADYHNPEHARAIIRLLDEYAMDPMGGKQPLPDYTRQNLIRQLSEFPGAFTLLAFDHGEAIGLANCFTGFSTFACKPLINIHDLAVCATHRGINVGQQLLNAVEQEARQRGACKLTLEVLSGNLPALGAYRKYGFEPYQLDSNSGEALFWQKKLGQA